ncbi:Decapping nuclease RAI1 [Lachnellula cervina]|uniref:Decapping nuclease n=1 Tax=Lachnellula cervina TaxID=1316786 RepID=A0A7D8YRJ3_9HELO|nr:Decapping nuclease RAI1 [Lachnellula cervina]
MSSSFDIQPVGRFHGQSAVIKRPKEIACFSYDDEHKFRLDDSSVRYYYPPTLGADLSKGFDTFEKLDDTADDHLDSLLKTIMALEQKEGKRVEADVITWRGMMTKFLAAIFTDRDGFEMNATLFQGTIFIEENHGYKLDSQKRQSQQRPQPGRPSQDMMSFWGYKFETLCLLPTTWDETPRDFIENRESEITSAEIRGDRDMVNFERKLMKFWIQSFLLGVPKIIVGFRTPDGILKRLENISTASIPSTVQRKGNATWDGNMCINFAAGLLDFLKATITEDGVWRIRRKERSSAIEVFRVEEAGHGDIIPDDFLNWRIKLAVQSQTSSE